MREILAKIQVQNTNITALGVQQGQMMACLQNAEQNWNLSLSSGQDGENTKVEETQGRNQYFATRQAKVDFP